MAHPKRVRAIVGFAVTIICVLYLYESFNLKQTLTAIAGLNFSYLFLGFLTLAFGYCVRILRWSFLLNSKGLVVKTQKCISPFLMSIALNNVLPMRAGDICRAVIFPSQMNVGKGHATGSLLIERLLDLFVLILYLIVALVLLKSDKISSTTNQLIISSGLLFIFTTAVLLFVSVNVKQRFPAGSEKQEPFGKYLPKDFTKFLVNVFESINSSLSQRKLISLLMLSILVWTGEIGLFFFVLQGTQSDFGIIAAILITSIGSLSTLIPSAPGYFGTFHVALLMSMELLETQPVDPLGLAILLHSALWICTTLPGLIACCYDTKFIKNLYGVGKSDDDQARI